ncbi:hypothetical protein SADUNF_Sadunf03G0131600 [Salix dunnii]|uniref:Uncharacterized protein n=1 Tax=Salix dunnii TaxID=1413687 RepID=A0A835TH94_9ROSI|nr:hypothetical protein SADUNF_Sadunf03G0131600 [Salix dunnii]
MTTSRRLADRKVNRFDKNISRRGAVPETSTKKGKDYPVGPLLLGFFIFVVIGSSRTVMLQSWNLDDLRLKGRRGWPTFGKVKVRETTWSRIGKSHQGLNFDLTNIKSVPRTIAFSADLEN